MNLLCEICLATSQVVFYQNEPYISIANWNINKTNKIKVNSSTYNNRLLIIWLSKDSSVRWNTSEMKTDVEIERNHKKKCRGKVETKNVTKHQFCKVIWHVKVGKEKKINIVILNWSNEKRRREFVKSHSLDAKQTVTHTN